MVRVECPDCGGNVETSASACTECGRPGPFAAGLHAAEEASLSRQLGKSSVVGTLSAARKGIFQRDNLLLGFGAAICVLLLLNLGALTLILQRMPRGITEADLYAAEGSEERRAIEARIPLVSVEGGVRLTTGNGNAMPVEIINSAMPVEIINRVDVKSSYLDPLQVEIVN